MTPSCPATRLVEVLHQVYAIADEHDLLVVNVFHAGDGNLHPILVFDAREPGVWDRVHAARVKRSCSPALQPGEC